MREQRSWRAELKWWVSAFASLLAVLFVFALIKVPLSVATLTHADTAVFGIADQYGDAIGQATIWPVAAIFAFYPFLFAAALGFRLLVPTFAGAPPRAVAVIVTTWPVAFGTYLISLDLGTTVLLTAVAVVWALAMPMPGRTAFSESPVVGGVIVGLAFSAIASMNILAGVHGLELAILWCAIRLWRRNSLEVAATALCAAAMPAIFLMSQLPHATLSANAFFLVVEVMILGGLSLAGAFLHATDGPESDEADDAEESPGDAIEATEA